MKKDRKLERYAKERLSELENDEFLAKLRDKVTEKPGISTARKSAIAALTGTIATAVIVAVTAVCVVLGDLRDKPFGGDNDFLYIAGNADFGISTLDELNGETAFVDMYVRGTDDLDVTRYFDKETNETEYYVVNTSSDVMAEKTTVCVVVNGYEYDGALSSAAMTNSIDFDGYTVKYDYSCYRENGGYMYYYQGVIDTDSEKIYIWYTACRQSLYDGFYAFASTMFFDGMEEKL